MDEIDARYVKFPSFSKWKAVSLNTELWDDFVADVSELRKSGSNQLDRALKLVTRAAAIETGIIENLYEDERGFTFTIAAEAASWEAALEARGKKTENLIRSQLVAYDYVMDFVTAKRPIVEAWIRELHEQLCKEQKTYDVHTATGSQTQELPLGQYKTSPNHVYQANKKIHVYAPVDMVGDEMARFVEELSSKEFKSSHPLLQAAYAHYVLVAIHPFADGNGRVARALASVFTYRAAFVPLLITAETRHEYFKALANADEGNYHSFVNFVNARSYEIIEIVRSSLQAARYEDPAAILENIEKHYLTEGGYTYEQIDICGSELLREFSDVYKNEFNRLNPKNVKPAWSFRSEKITDLEKGHRSPVNVSLGSVYCPKLKAPAPANAELEVVFNVQVPISGASNDTIIVKSSLKDSEGKRPVFEAALSDLIPHTSKSVQMKLLFFAQHNLSIAMSVLKVLAERNLEGKGYLPKD